MGLRHFEEELDELRKRLLEMSGLVESAIYRSVHSLSERDEGLAELVFKTEARINQMEIEIDDMAVRLLALEQPVATDLRLITSAIKINNDLERMGDLAVNLSQSAISLAAIKDAMPPAELEPMTAAVRAMISKSLGALIHQNVDLAAQVLESDDVVDQYRDRLFEGLLAGMSAHPTLAAPNLHFILASRHLERIADHTTNIAEDVVFWIRGLEVRHGRARLAPESAASAQRTAEATA